MRMCYMKKMLMMTSVLLLLISFETKAESIPQNKAFSSVASESMEEAILRAEKEKASLTPAQRKLGYHLREEIKRETSQENALSFNSAKAAMRYSSGVDANVLGAVVYDVEIKCIVSGRLLNLISN